MSHPTSTTSASPEAPGTTPAAPGDRRVGFIGLGVMGGPMAGHMLAAGHPLHVTARRRTAAAHLVEAGATWHATAREVAAHSDVVVLMVPDLPDVEAVLDGPDGLLAGVGHPVVLVISSTVSPDGVRRLDGRLRQATGGLVHVVDAPVSGGEEGAVAGRSPLWWAARRRTSRWRSRRSQRPGPRSTSARPVRVRWRRRATR